MATNHYDWSNGPDAIQQHSIAKHRILQSYLSAYFQTLAMLPLLVSIAHPVLFAGNQGYQYLSGKNRHLCEVAP